MSVYMSSQHPLSFSQFELSFKILFLVRRFDITFAAVPSKLLVVGYMPTYFFPTLYK